MVGVDFVGFVDLEGVIYECLDVFVGVFCLSVYVFVDECFCGL